MLIPNIDRYQDMLESLEDLEDSRDLEEMRRKPHDKGIYYSESVKGFWLKVSWLWQKPLPPILEVCRELGLLK